MGLAIWLVPSRPTAEKLKSVMHSHPRSKPPSTSYPHFHPHVTLASTDSSTPLKVVVSSIPRDLCIPVNFQELKVGDHFFHSIYLSVHLSPALSAIHKSIHAALKGVLKPSSFPLHMSIFYIDDTEDEERMRMAKELEATGKVRQGENCVELKYSADGEDEWIDGFQGKEIWIVDCDGPVERWVLRVLEKIELA